MTPQWFLKSEITYFRDLEDISFVYLQQNLINTRLYFRYQGFAKLSANDLANKKLKYLANVLNNDPRANFFPHPSHCSFLIPRKTSKNL